MPVDPVTLCWTPRGTYETRVGKPCSPPKVRKYVPSSPPKQTKRTITTLTNDPDSVAMLERLIEKWLSEATRLETTTEDVSLTEQLARLMFSFDVKNQIAEQEKKWDPKGDGTIVIGEFRAHIRGVGLQATNEELDALFEQWDKDHSGKIEMQELYDALTQLQRDFLRKFGRNGAQGWKLTTEQQAEQLRARAAAGKLAIEATKKAEQQQAELDALIVDIEGRIAVQVGLMLTSRKIRVGEVVGSWTKTKGNSAKRELSKAEFKDEVFKLGVSVNGELVTRKSLGELFDTVDV